MTDNFIAFFYRERLLVAVVSMIIVAGGIFALRRLNVDAFPTSRQSRLRSTQRRKVSLPKRSSGKFHFRLKTR
jgi:Cu/Ag efflux pump CusA